LFLNGICYVTIWYCKGIPNINTGLLLMMLCIIVMYQMCEIKNVSSISRLISYVCINTQLTLVLLIMLVLMDVCFGSQLPQDMYLSSGRVFLVYKCVILVSDVWCYVVS